MSDEPEEESIEEETVDEEPVDEAAEEAADSTDDETEEADTSGVQSGDVVRVDLTAYTAENEMLVDTTDPEVAAEEGVDEDQTFEPRVVVIGEGHLFSPVEDALIGLEPGDTTSVVVPAAEAFGEHDPDQVRTISTDKISEDERYPGAYVEIDGQRGFIETIIGGRSRVDFNHPFAGEDIEYDVELIEWLDDRDELAQGLIKNFLDLELEVWFQTDEVEVEPEVPEDEDEDEVDPEELEPEIESVESLYIEATPQLTMNQQWLFGKQQIATTLMDQLDVDRVVVQEIIESPQMPFGGMDDLLDEEGLGDIDADLEDELEDELEE